MEFTAIFALVSATLAVAMGEQAEAHSDKAVLATTYLDEASNIIKNIKAKAKIE